MKTGEENVTSSEAKFEVVKTDNSLCDIDVSKEKMDQMVLSLFRILAIKKK